jgi:hypothetical protein
MLRPRPSEPRELMVNGQPRCAPTPLGQPAELWADRVFTSSADRALVARPRVGPAFSGRNGHDALIEQPALAIEPEARTVADVPPLEVDDEAVVPAALPQTDVVQDGEWELCTTACWRGYATARFYAHPPGDAAVIVESSPSTGGLGSPLREILEPSRRRSRSSAGSWQPRAGSLSHAATPGTRSGSAAGHVCSGDLPAPARVWLLTDWSINHLNAGPRWGRGAAEAPPAARRPARTHDVP